MQLWQRNCFLQLEFKFWSHQDQLCEFQWHSIALLGQHSTVNWEKTIFSFFDPQNLPCKHTHIQAWRQKSQINIFFTSVTNLKLWKAVLTSNTHMLTPTLHWVEWHINKFYSSVLSRFCTIFATAEYRRHCLQKLLGFP